jgi:hypothetical protein
VAQGNLQATITLAIIVLLSAGHSSHNRAHQPGHATSASGRKIFQGTSAALNHAHTADYLRGTAIDATDLIPGSAHLHYAAKDHGWIGGHFDPAGVDVESHARAISALAKQWSRLAARRAGAPS